jgi:cellulose synthase/poly-beta-1,6-N-acetylglucosamine synthase-like glycosyltransferase
VTLLVDLTLVALSLPVLVCAGYTALLAVASRRRAPRAYGAPATRFDIVIPAHDEEAGIAATVQSLLGTDYPTEMRRVLVVADNCSDATAERAEAAGATVLVRNDSERRGKGYALAHAFERSQADGLAGAVVVVDADTTVTPNLLRAFDARFTGGASAVQAEYGVRNPLASWRTRLMVIALALFHVLRSLGRERLGVSAGLRGNGMGFTTPLLASVPHDAFSVVEDLEYGIRLGFAGHRVHYVDEARVLGEMVSSEQASRSQRTRWEAGRFAIARTHAPRLIAEAIRRHDPVLADLAMDVLVPPLTWLVLSILLGSVVTVAWSAWSWHATGALSFAWVPWVLSFLFVASYVARGVVLAGVGMAGVRDLLWAPVYMVWKVVLTLKQRGQRKDQWIRTTRETREKT